jgi:hypothetical protein
MVGIYYYNAYYEQKTLFDERLTLISTISKSQIESILKERIATCDSWARMNSPQVALEL